jgi:hypothetical protein
VGLDSDNDSNVISTTNIGLDVYLTPEELSPCGTTPREARMNGCYFDPLSFSWVLPEFYDFSLTAEILQLRPNDAGTETEVMESGYLFP